MFTTCALLSLCATAASAARASAPHPSGYMSICKQQSGTGLEGAVFNFKVGRAVYSAPVGGCSAAFPVQTGHVTVTELPRSGSQLVGVSTVPADRLVKRDVPHRSAIVNVVAGDVSHETIVTFTNRIDPNTGFLKICKIAGTGVAVGRPFTFTAGGERTNVTAGPRSEGGYCVLVGAFRKGRVTVTERPSAGTHVESIGVQPMQRQVAKNKDRRTVTVSIRPGVTVVVTYTNARGG
jgi:hypothetical protein